MNCVDYFHWVKIELKRTTIFFLINVITSSQQYSSSWVIWLWLLCTFFICFILEIFASFHHLPPTEYSSRLNVLFQHVFLFVFCWKKLKQTNEKKGWNGAMQSAVMMIMMISLLCHRMRNTENYKFSQMNNFLGCFHMCGIWNMMEWDFKYQF